MPSPRFLLGLSTGVLFGAAVSALLFIAPSGIKASLLGGRSSSSIPPVTQCAVQLDTSGWERFRSEALGWEFLYPPSYRVEQNGTSVSIDATEQPMGAIILEKLHGSLRNVVDPSMEQASWKIADRNTYALTTPYFSESPEWLTATYLFIRDFPLKGEDGAYNMARATIALPRSAPEFQRAREMGITDLESILTEPEQILSTFRFLQFDELSDERER